MNDEARRVLNEAIEVLRGGLRYARFMGEVDNYCKGISESIESLEHFASGLENEDE